MITLEVLGVTLQGEIAYRFNQDGQLGETLTLTQDDLGVLSREIQRDGIPLWPTEPCRFCGTDSVATVEGHFYCEAHAMGYGMAEEAS